MSSASTRATGTGARLGWSLALLATAQLIFSLDINIVFVALPEIGADLGFPGQTQQLVVSSYVVFAGGFLLLGGRMADMLGRRRVFVAALATYAVSSLAGGLAWSPEVIVAARALQGIGGALLLPSTLSLVNTLFEEGPKRNRALAIWGGAGASGLTVGALLGGVLTELFGWPAVFLVNVPLAGGVALAALAVIPADGARTRGRRFDLPGAITATVGATLVVFGLVQGTEVGWSDLLVVGSLAVGAVFLALFALTEARSKDPLMPFRLFKGRNLTVGASVTFIYMGTFGALPYFLTVLLNTVHGFSALQTGLGFLVPSLAIMTGTQLGERLTNRMGTRGTLLLGFGIGVVGTALLAVGFDAEATYAMALPGLIVSGVGQGIVWTAMWIAAATGVAPEEQGVANGVATTTLNIGNAIGMALLIGVSSAGAAGLEGQAELTALADGGFVAVLLAAAGMFAGLLITLALPRNAPTAPSVEGPAAPDPSEQAHATTG
ncbi:MFS transporter [Nocardiopsis suaedae]|uniref:MFS transporter n=1 Tax=Nocardiopsis suaedae TaxID=3018444 RepID=A0ABT4TTQ1_9ACTN|nr:MFS transporter [Nocardiopsis suaedae]MDA2807634.1 MFS transporter [Nocardiopsis suaedae]